MNDLLTKVNIRIRRYNRLYEEELLIQNGKKIKHCRLHIEVEGAAIRQWVAVLCVIMVQGQI